MKRFWMFALVVGLVAGFGLATAFSAAFAQTDTPQNPQGTGPWGQGMMGGRGARMGGMMGGYAQQAQAQGPMHEYMHEALAAALGLDEAELDQLHAEGQTFWQIAEAQGFTAEQASQMMADARSTALDQMVADGVITAEQAEFMKTRMGGRMGAAGCQGTGVPGQMMRGRAAQGWNR